MGVIEVLRLTSKRRSVIATRCEDVRSFVPSYPSPTKPCLGESVRVLTGPVLRLVLGPLACFGLRFLVGVGTPS
jgi:hypothetical protein